MSIKNAPKNVSLESPVKEVEDGNIEMLDLIEDMQAISQEDQMAYNHLKKRIQDALTPRNYAIFELVEQGYTNQEIANRLNGQFPDEPNISVGEGVSVTMVEKIRPTIKKLLNQEEEYLRNL